MCVSIEFLHPTASIQGEWMAYVGSYDGTFYAFKVAELAAGGGFRERRSSLGFWLSFPIALSCVALFAFGLTVLHRRRSKPEDGAS